MKIDFRFLSFEVNEDKITLNGFPFVEIQIAGENKDSHFGNKMIKSSEGWKLKYVSHVINDNSLVITQKTDKVIVKTSFKGYDDTNTVSIFTEVINDDDEAITLEEVSAFSYFGVAGDINTTKDAYLYKFTQSHHGECQPKRFRLFDLGLFNANPVSQKRINGCNVGGWSTKEELPLGILEYENKYLMYQIESNNSWYYEISDFAEKLYLYLGGRNLAFTGFSKKLDVHESYITNSVAITQSDSLSSVIAEMTKYRRHIAGVSKPDKNLPTIFNEYMHLSWDSPTEENTRLVADVVAKTGVKYYVIDCGWHNEEKGSEVYPYVGQWKESQARFPHGLKATTDYIKSLGMKPGLWIEPEIIGYKCQEMLDYYDDSCFITRFGKKIFTMGRYFLDFRNERVYNYMSDTIKRMVVDYGALYIKMDYNEELGIGTDKYSDSFGDGLELCSKAYLKWIDDMRATYKDVLFETCSSGGMRMDYETLKHFSIISTSDQTNYQKYPYIAGNILSAVLPEQAAVWSYPVDSYGEPNSEFTPTYEWVNKHITKEQVIMNMINSFLGRMHLASHIELLTKQKLSFIKQGVEYYNSLTKYKKKGIPYFPLGFTDFDKTTVASGFRCDNKLFLAVWNLGGKSEKTIKVDLKISKAIIAYPKNSEGLLYDESNIYICLPSPYSARFLEIDLKD